MSIRDVLRRARAEAGYRLGAYERGRRQLDGSRAVILMYHRVLPRQTASELAVESGMYVTPQTFRQQLRWLREDFQVLALRELVGRLKRAEALPPRCAAITFDDGWLDNLQFALPELEAEQLPATIFLVAGRVGTPGAFWPDEVCRRLAALPADARDRLLADLGVARGDDPAVDLLAFLKALSEAGRADVLGRLRDATPPPAAPERELLDWAEVERMSAGAIDFESHGSSHAILTDVEAAQAKRELDEARSVLAERGLGQGGLLAYPSGGHDPAVRQLAREAGYSAAVTTDVGFASSDSDLFSLPRIGIHEDVSRSRAEFLRLVLGAGS